MNPSSLFSQAAAFNKITATILLTYMFFTASVIRAQVSVSWTDNYSGSGARVFSGHKALLDGNGNVYSSVSYNLVDSLLTDANNNSIQASHPAGVIVGKYNNIGGTQNWTRSIADVYVKPASFRSDATNNFYAAVTQASGNGSNRNISVYKFTSAGTQTNLFTYSGAAGNHDEVEDMVLDIQGNILLAGSTNNAAGMLVVKYSGSGSQLWENNLPLSGSGFSNAIKMGTDASSNVFVMGINYGLPQSQYYLSSWLANGIFNYSVPVSTGTYSDLIFKDFVVDANGNSYCVFAGNTGINTYDIVVFKFDINGSVSIPYNYSCSGNYSLAHAKILNGSSAGILLLAYDNQGSNTINILRLNNEVPAWNQIKNNASVRDMSMDASGNLYVLSSVPGTDGADQAITKISSSGIIGNDVIHDLSTLSGDDFPTSVAVSSSGIVTISGISGNDVPLDKIFLIRLSSNLSVSWTRTGYDFTDGSVSSITNPATQEFYVSGNTRNSNNVSDIYLVKYNVTGTEQWRLNFELPDIDEVTASKQLALDAQGNVFIAGYVNANVSSRNIVVYKINPQGIRLWKRTYNGPGNSEDIVSSLTTDAAGNVWICGTTRITSVNRNILLLKYSSSGSLLLDINLEGPAAGEDLGKDIAVQGQRVYLLGEVTSTGNQKDISVYSYDLSGNLLGSYLKNNPSGDDIAVALKYREGIVMAGNLFVSTGIYRGYAARLSDSFTGNPTIINEKVFGDGTNNLQINDVDLNYSTLAVCGFRGTAAASSCYTAKLNTITNVVWENTLPASPVSANKNYNCSATPQGQVFVGGTLRSSSGNDDISFLTFTSQGQLLSNDPIASASGSIDQLAFAGFDGFKVTFAGQSNPQNNSDGFQGVLIRNNFSPQKDSLDTIFACGNQLYEKSFRLLDEDTQSVLVSLTSSNNLLIPSDSISVSISGTHANLVIHAVPDTTASLQILLSINDQINPVVNYSIPVFISRSPDFGSISGALNVTENTNHTYVATDVSPEIPLQWSFSATHQSLQASGDSVLIQFSGSSGYLVCTTSNECGSYSDSVFIEVSPANQPPQAILTDSVHVCGAGTYEVNLQINYESAGSVIVLATSGNQSLISDNSITISGFGDNRIIAFTSPFNGNDSCSIHVSLIDSLGVGNVFSFMVFFHPEVEAMGIIGPQSVTSNSTHTYNIGSLVYADSVAWTFIGQAISAVDSMFSVELTFANQSGFLTYKASNGCGIVTDSMYITVNAPNLPPTISISPGQLETCAGDGPWEFQVTLTDENIDSLILVIQASDTMAVQGISINGTGSSRTLVINHLNYSSFIQYVSIQVTDSVGQQSSDTAFIGILPAPETLGISGQDTVLPGSMHTYQLIGNTGGASIQWHYNGTFLPVNTDTAAVSFQNTSGWLTCSTSLGTCTKTDSLFVFVDTTTILTHTQSQATPSQVALFPNPIGSNEVLKVFSESYISEIQIIDCLGRVIWRENTGAIGFSEIPLSGISSGAYLLVFRQDNLLTTKQLIVK